MGRKLGKVCKTVKVCLRKVLARSKISYFNLLTLLSDIKHSINSRPLTYFETERGFETVTPNSLIHPLSPPESIIRETDDKVPDSVSRSDILDTLNARNELLKYFNEIWNTAYLLSLRERQNNEFQVNFKNKIKLNEIVLIRNPMKARPFWTLGKVIQLFPGYDGLIRAVLVQRGDGVKTKYSIKHLYPLELHVSDIDPGISSGNATAAESAAQDDTDNNDPVDTLDTNPSNNTPAIPANSNPLRRSARVRERKQTTSNRNDDFIYY